VRRRERVSGGLILPWKQSYLYRRVGYVASSLTFQCRSYFIVFLRCLLPCHPYILYILVNTNDKNGIMQRREAVRWRYIIMLLNVIHVSAQTFWDGAKSELLTGKKAKLTEFLFFNCGLMFKLADSPQLLL